MTAEPCRCGHPRDAHPDVHAGMCVVLHCECHSYREPLTRPARPLPLRDLIAAGRASKRASTRRIAERIHADIPALLAELRSERGGAPAAPATPKERRATRGQPVACLDCGRECRNPSGLSAHRRFAHGTQAGAA